MGSGEDSEEGFSGRFCEGLLGGIEEGSFWWNWRRTAPSRKGVSGGRGSHNVFNGNHNDGD